MVVPDHVRAFGKEETASLNYVQGVAARARVHSKKSALCALCAFCAIMCIMCTGYRTPQSLWSICLDVEHMSRCVQDESIFILDVLFCKK